MNIENSADHNTDHISREKITIKPDELQQAIEQAAAILKAAGADAVYLFGSVSFFKGPKSEPVLRLYCGNSPSLEMDSYLTEHGETLKVELWEKEKGFCLHLTYEYAYELDKDHRDSLVPALSRYAEDAFLDQYYHLFEPLEHYTR
jgi:hypothetical protein